MADTTHARTADEREAAVLDRITEFRRRRPRLRDDVVTLAHGAGGKASAALVDAVFLEAFAGGEPEALPDAATLTLPTGERLAFSTDSFVVKPLRFPGGSIGHLAVHGTVNDLAVQGAEPAWLSAAFVIEEGFPVAELREIVADMAEAASAANVQIVTGDTKVVGRGAADGLFITTAGVGVIPVGREVGPTNVQPGDRVLVSGTLADHGMAVMLARGDLALEADIRSDTAPLGDLVRELLQAAPNARWMRDPTRGGVGTIANELARDTGLAVVLDEASLPVLPAVNGACDLLGIDPLYVANEGKVLAVVPPEESDAALPRNARSSARCFGSCHRRDGSRTGRHRGPPHDVWRDAHRRHARRRPAPPHLLRARCDDAHPAPRHRHRAGRRLPSVRVPPRGGARARGVGPQRQRRRADRRRRRACAHRGADPRPDRGTSAIGARHDRHGGGRGAAWRARGLLDRRERRVRCSLGPGERRQCDVRRLPGGDRQPCQPPVPLPVHELHELRPAVHDRARSPVRPSRYHHARLRDVRRVPRRVRRPLRPALPRAAQRVRRVRAAARVA